MNSKTHDIITMCFKSQNGISAKLVLSIIESVYYTSVEYYGYRRLLNYIERCVIISTSIEYYV